MATKKPTTKKKAATNKKTARVKPKRVSSKKVGTDTKNKPIKRRLKSMDDIRRFVADTVNRLNRDEIEANKASKLGYLCQILARVIEGSDLEGRVAEVEKAIKQIR